MRPRHPKSAIALVATQPIDFRKGVHGLVALVAEGLGGKPYSGDVYVFRSKRSDRLKLLVFDGSGMVLATKWLENGGFAWPPVREGTMPVTGAQLAMLIEGKRYERPTEPRTWCGRPTHRA
ncbi:MULTISPECIES: IS66 family insertion sequence element accessory protein TnpB [Bradyrhizobium]|uniref:IS66 family insertion sequence element accessory protein TnpB n=1 Tax=Bradyrhizobium sp. USDA 241 TaxID=3377725 RepID=UPI003A5DCF2D|nr:IS66 family insertion sequence element accessory protein TnpB [Bradyrhizobium japonicum USDA 135]